MPAKPASNSQKDHSYGPEVPKNCRGCGLPVGDGDGMCFDEVINDQDSHTSCVEQQLVNVKSDLAKARVIYEHERDVMAAQLCMTKADLTLVAAERESLKGKIDDLTSALFSRGAIATEPATAGRNPWPSPRLSRAVPGVTVELRSTDIELLCTVLGVLKDSRNVVFLENSEIDTLTDLEEFFNMAKKS